MYVIFTAWLSAHHKKNDTGWLEYIALLWIVAIGFAAFIMSTKPDEASMKNLYLFWLGFSVLCAIGDFRNVYCRGLPEAQRIVRHVWRVGFSLVWAVLALTDKIVKMQGLDIKTMPEGQVVYIVAVPTALVFLIILYWVGNILFVSRESFSR